MNDDVRLTPKLPALVGGLLALVGGLVTTKNGRTGAGVVLLIIGMAFVIYSSFIKDWCVVHQNAWGGAWGTQSFGGSLGDCIKQKGLLDF